MKRKTWIWIGVGVLVIILVSVLVSRANQAANAKEDEIDEKERKDDEQLISDPSRRDCRKYCRTACKAGRTAIFGGRGRCRRKCKADCASQGMDYVKANY